MMHFAFLEYTARSVRRGSAERGNGNEVGPHEERLAGELTVGKVWAPFGLRGSP